jgi:hypothetical protein
MACRHRCVTGAEPLVLCHSDDPPSTMLPKEAMRIPEVSV